jgi:hypothetical protein
MPVPPLDAGRLPLGRWAVSVSEVEAAFVTGQSARRQKVWGDWLTLTRALREIVDVVPAAWLGGSFLTDKDEPGDVDSVYVVEAHRLLSAKGDPGKAQFLQVLADMKVKDVFDLDVDSFILEWVPRPGVQPAPWAAEYLGNRGYWDDLWSRERSSDTREDSVPRRGYLEVILDGFN